MILWLGVVFVWLIVDRAARPAAAFATGAVVLGFAATLALNAIDPDALIARTNLVAAAPRRAYVGRPERRRGADAARAAAGARAAAARQIATALLATPRAGRRCPRVERLALARPCSAHRASSRARRVRAGPVKRYVQVAVTVPLS